MTTNQAPEPDSLDALRTEIYTALSELDTLVDLIAALTTSTQRGLGFLTYEGRQALDRQTIEERTERRTQPVRDQGLKWLNRTTTTPGTGDVEAPGNFKGISTEVDIHYALRHEIRRLVRACADVVLPHAKPNPTAHDLINQVRSLATQAEEPALTPLARELAHLITQAEAVVDGNDRAQLGDCPHCRLPTLVYLFRLELARCDRDPTREHYQPCRCSDPLCECKAAPVSFRHEWHRKPGHRQLNLNSLASRLNARRRAEIEGDTR